MIIEYDAVFGVKRIIIFQLSSWFDAIPKSSEAVYEVCKSVLGFSWLAVPTRHPV